MKGDMLTVADIQDKYAITRSVAYDLVRRLPPEIVYLIGPRTIRVDADGLDNFLHDQARKTA